ncbi:MAG: hypothetical protein SGPRY_009534 [Prymnesium sp.]
MRAHTPLAGSLYAWQARSSPDLELARSLQELEVSQRSTEAELKNREDLLLKMEHFGRIFGQPAQEASYWGSNTSPSTQSTQVRKISFANSIATPRRQSSVVRTPGVVKLGSSKFSRLSMCSLHLDPAESAPISRSESHRDVVRSSASPAAETPMLSVKTRKQKGKDLARWAGEDRAGRGERSGNGECTYQDPIRAAEREVHARSEEVRSEEEYESPLVRLANSNGITSSDDEIMPVELAWSFVTLAMHARLSRRAMSHPLPLFTYRFLVRLLGSREEARRRMAQLHKSMLLCRFAPTDSPWAPRLRMFARLLGEYDSVPHDCELYMKDFPPTMPFRYPQATHRTHARLEGSEPLQDASHARIEALILT